MGSGRIERARRALDGIHENIPRNATLGDLHRDTPWLWLHCEKRPHLARRMRRAGDPVGALTRRATSCGNAHSKNPPPPVRVAKSRQRAHCLALRVDRFAAALVILAPVRDQAPAQRVERYLARVVVAPDNQQLLAGRAVPARRVVVETAAAPVQALGDRELKRRTALDNSPTHNSECGVHAW